jgi:FtsZ-binding cell division protein ZapB
MANNINQTDHFKIIIQLKRKNNRLQQENANLIKENSVLKRENFTLETKINNMVDIEEIND